MNEVSNEIYVFADPLGDRPFRAGADIETVELLKFIGYGHGEIPDTPPLLYRHMGRRIPSDDVIWASFIGVCYVSSRVLGVMRREGLTGWDSFPVSIRDAHGTLHDTHAGLIIRGRSGPIDWSKGEKIARTEDYPRGEYYLGGELDLDHWDHSDIFIASNGGWKFVTSRFVQTFRKHRIGNVLFTPLSEYETRVPRTYPGTPRLP